MRKKVTVMKLNFNLNESEKNILMTEGEEGRGGGECRQTHWKKGVMLFMFKVFKLNESNGVLFPMIMKSMRKLYTANKDLN